MKEEQQEPAENCILHGVLKLSAACLAGLSLAGCGSHGVIENTPATETTAQAPYSLKAWNVVHGDNDVAFVLTFSGGGTRAAAMAYGVLEELRDTKVVVGGRQRRLLDEVDHISSVSGGSFTAAYYGLHGEGIFETFEEDFLRRNIEGHLTASLFNPLHWFGSKGRTTRAIDYYQETIFHDATFADMMRPGHPMIMINASDLAEGVRFSFIQEYFDFLGSDLKSFPVASAVAASSAVPVVFNPVVLENYPDDEGRKLPWPDDARQRAHEDAEFAMLYKGLNSYRDKERRKYIHFVDGGITDNMGLRAVFDVITIAGGARAYIQKVHKKRPRKVVLISVNAETRRPTEMNRTTRQPSMLAAINAMTNTQLHRYNTATVDLVQNELASWAASLSSPGSKVTPHFIQVSFEQVQQPTLKAFLNKVPTSFNLEDEQVDALIGSARVLLRENPDFQKMLADLGS